MAAFVIDDFALLQENWYGYWDGYGASQISEEARRYAHRFINEVEAAPSEVPFPEVSPKPTGTISFEWGTLHAEVYTSQPKPFRGMPYGGR